MQVFLASQTQWRTGGLGGVTGLDYGAVAQVMRWLGIPARQRADVWRDVQVLEGEGLAVFREKAEREAAGARR